jgi:hypothetical protein
VVVSRHAEVPTRKATLADVRNAEVYYEHGLHG